jgi:sulfur carrier protein ThiS
MLRSLNPTESDPENGGGKLKVILTREGREKEIDVGEMDTVMDVIRSVEMPPDGVLAFSEDIPLPLDESIEGFDCIEIVNVASGG